MAGDLKDRVDHDSDPFPLYAKQEAAIRKIRDRKFFGIFFEMRTGKTAIILKHLTYLREAKGVKKILVMAPPSAIPGWVDNIMEWSPWFLTHLYIGNRKVFDQWNEADEGFMILSDRLVGSGAPEPGETKYKVFAQCINRMDCMVVDECHSIKNYTAVRTRFALAAGKRADYRYIMTGTPIAKGEEDVYYQMKFLSPKIFDGMNREQFLRGYFHVFGRGTNQPEITFNEQCRDVFDAKLAEHTLTLRMEDIQETPMEINDIPVPIEGTREQETLLTQLKKTYVVKMESGEVTAVTAAAMLQKANQLENGHVLDTEGKPHDLARNPKLDWFRQEAPKLMQKEKVIVWVIYKRDRLVIKRALDELGIWYVDFKSGLTPAKRGALLDLFRTSEARRAIIAHPASAGMGVNLHVAPTSIVYSRNHDWLAFAQAQARNRGISTEKVDVYHPFLKGGVDEQIYKRLRQKGDKAGHMIARGVMNSWAGVEE